MVGTYKFHRYHCIFIFLLYIFDIMASVEQPQASQIRKEVDAYYQSALGQSFRDLDDTASLQCVLRTVQSQDARNFVLDFSEVAAYMSCDVSSTAIDALLDAERPDSLSTRWINVWCPQRQASLIEVLARRYDFSPRLLALMVSDSKQRDSTRNQQTEFLRSSSHKLRRRLGRNGTPQRSTEDEIQKNSEEFSELSVVSSLESVSKGNLYKIIDDLWHYHSIDFGRSFVCMGYNSLYGVEDSIEENVDGRLPRCIRLWTWLILCDDHTVISINEDPFPFEERRLDQSQLRTLTETRRNLVNVFRSLSKAEEASLLQQKPLARFPIRARLGDTEEESAHRLSDMPGLLFYYLFENWHNSYTLITRRESRYGTELKDLRAQMFDKPDFGLIDRLDMIGTQLGVLKRHFASYDRLIDRLLETRTITNASIQNLRVDTLSSQASLDTVRQAANDQPTTLGVSLSSPARVRFERLKDFVEMYALKEVEEYLKQKESLVNLNLQLITIKESLDVEKLTRITLLLTKLTCVFLPVSLMTAYFSVPLSDVVYDLQSYWISFAVTMFLSLGALFVFGVFSGTVQMLPFWRDLWGSTKDAGTRLRNRM